MKALIITNVTNRFQVGHFSMITPLEELGYEVHWVANFSEKKSDSILSPVRTHHIDFYRNPFDPRNLIAFNQLINLLRKEQFDVIHCNSPIGGVLGRICGKIIGVRKIIYTAHGFHFYKGSPFINKTLFKAVEMWLAHYTDTLITINQEDFQSAQHLNLRRNGTVHRVPGVGVDTSLIRNTSSMRSELLQEIGADSNSILIISVGELNNNKNNRVIIEALGKLQNSSVHYLLCGIGEKRSKLELLAKQQNIKSNVHFLGYRTDIPQLLKSSDIFVMPSLREGLSRSIMEAMSVGLPCVVSEIRGNVDLIDHARGGFLCKPDDIIGFSEAIDMLLKESNLRKEMGLYNLEIIKRFDIQHVKMKMKEIYTEVLL